MPDQTSPDFNGAQIVSMIEQEYLSYADYLNNNALHNYNLWNASYGPNPHTPPMLVKVVKTGEASWEVQNDKVYVPPAPKPPAPVSTDRIGAPASELSNIFYANKEACVGIENGYVETTDIRGIFVFTRYPTPFGDRMWWTLKLG